jgi:hypothetical protein
MEKSRLEIDEKGTKFWKLNGEYHREDGPAIEHFNGTKKWYINGKLHREGKPAVESLKGNGWYLNGELHRIDGPALEYHDGRNFWYLNGRICKNQGEWFKALTSEQQINYLWNLV